ncbi:hypothetical protein [Pseudomonas aphyarum]|uniref:Uncharacterized protein n=1 Tax=Pseudomonas aphyarum TaxID=2942629 RepID=A0ABT5PH32_9PSED|nr:hypothetical protein [Pseudomonas aphyarum]MDD0967783.1 hypothetical protein [Pseudomonas aphyarum]MDD1123094.1 hypothetical protein [Pseudomonas aphyarum]
MKQIVYAGNDRQPCVAEYAIVMDDSEMIQRAHIVVVQSSNKGVWTSLYNADEGRDNVLNRIMTQELPGVRTDFLSFNVILDLSDRMEGFRFPIRLNWDDYISKGNPYSKHLLPTKGFKAALLKVFGKGAFEIRTWNVVGGCADFYTDFMDPERERLDIAQASRLLEQAGYSRTVHRA